MRKAARRGDRRPAGYGRRLGSGGCADGVRDDGAVNEPLVLTQTGAADRTSTLAIASMFECSVCGFCPALKMAALPVHGVADERTWRRASPGYSLALLWSENGSTESQESRIN